MAFKGIFKTHNLYLAFAGILSAAMIFAPLAYASNYESLSHVTIYGAWLSIDYPLVEGSKAVEYRYLLQLPLNICYVLVSGVLAGGLGFLAIYNRDLSKKRKWLWWASGLAVLQVIFAVLIRIFASVFLDDIESIDNMQVGFMREVLFHLFIIYFLFRASIRLKRVELNLAEE